MSSNHTLFSITSCCRLHNGVEIPWLGLGTYKSREGNEVRNAVKTALETGYRSIDTASFYANERSVGQAVRESGVPRDEIFVTTKVWNDDQGYEKTLKAFEVSRELLGLETIDLYLLHWPVGTLFAESWRALEKLYRDGLVRAIGVSNFLERHIEKLLETAEIVPMINQVEFHPLLQQPELREYCTSRDIRFQAWSPLTRGKHLDTPVISEIASAHNKTPAQVVLRWDLQQEVITIPKSVTPERIRENAGIFDFKLTPEDISRIGSLDKGYRLGPDPAQFESYRFTAPS